MTKVRISVYRSPVLISFSFFVIGQIISVRILKDLTERYVPVTFGFVSFTFRDVFLTFGKMILGIVFGDIRVFFIGIFSGRIFISDVLTTRFSGIVLFVTGVLTSFIAGIFPVISRISTVFTSGIFAVRIRIFFVPRIFCGIT